MASSTSRKKSTAGQPPPSQPIPVLLPKDTFGHELANWMFPGYLAVMLLGMILIRQFGMFAGNTNGVRRLFLAVNAGTLTGFADSSGVAGLERQRPAHCPGADRLRQPVQHDHRRAGCQTHRADALQRRPDHRRRLHRPGRGDAAGRGAAAKRATIRVRGLVLSTSAFGNCALYPGELPPDTDILVHLILLPLTILGGLGLPVLMEIVDATLFHKPLSSHSRGVLGVSAWLYLLGFAALLSLSLTGQVPTVQSTLAAVRQSSVLAVQSRTGGLDISPVRLVPESARWVLIVLMMIGASPAGTGSGLKTTTLAELFRGTRRLLRGLPVSRSLGIALTWLGTYLAMLLSAVVLLSHVNPVLSTDHLLFTAVSGISNVGFSLSDVPDQKNVMFAYCAIMLLGRMVPLMILWWMAETTRDADWAIG